MWKAAFLPVCIYFLGVCRGCPGDLNFLNVDLSEEVNCTSPVRDKILHVSISWLDRPPYIYGEEGPRIGKNSSSEKFPKNTANSSEESQVEEDFSKSKENVKGIFYEIINKGMQLCSAPSTRRVANFAMKVQNLQQLDQSIVNKTVDFAVPVHGGDDGKYGEYSYVEILKSPGVVFIVNKEETREHFRKQVVQAMKDTWPVIVITFLLTGFAGLVIWGLVSSRLYVAKMFYFYFIFYFAKRRINMLIVNISRLGRPQLRDRRLIDSSFTIKVDNWT